MFVCCFYFLKVETRRLSETEEGAPSSVTHTFICNRWFAKNEDDGAIVRELVPSKVLQEAVDKDGKLAVTEHRVDCLLYTSPSPRDKRQSRMPSSA